jgi:quercetin dioxygenase-like cupin family protein
MPVWKNTNIHELAQFSPEHLVNLNLYDGDAFFGRLICFSRGQSVPVHTHDHKDECFDVVEGQGTLLIGGSEIAGVPGTSVYVPAGTAHGLRSDGTDYWIVRETVSERVYARRAIALVGRALLKRLRRLLGLKIEN